MPTSMLVDVWLERDNFSGRQTNAEICSSVGNMICKGSDVCEVWTLPATVWVKFWCIVACLSSLRNRWNLRAPCDRAVYESYVVFCKIFSMLIAHKQSLSGNDKWNAILLLQVWMATIFAMANRVTEIQTSATMIRICCQNCLVRK